MCVTFAQLFHFEKFYVSLFLSLSMELSIHSSISRSPSLSSQFHEVQPLIMHEEETEDVLFTDVPDNAPSPKKEEEPPAFAKKEKAKVQRSAATPALAKKEKAKVQRSAAPGADQRTKKVLEPALEKIVEVEKIVTKEVPVDRLVVVEVPIKRALCVCVCDCVCACVFVHDQSSAGQSCYFHTDIHEGRNHSEKLLQKPM